MVVFQLMKEGRCTKRYRREFIGGTQTGGNEYHLHRRRKPNDAGWSTTTNMCNIDVDVAYFLPIATLLLTEKDALKIVEKPQNTTHNSFFKLYMYHISGVLLLKSMLAHIRVLFMRLLWHTLTEPTSLIAMKIVNGGKYQTYRETCFKLLEGL